MLNRNRWARAKSRPKQTPGQMNKTEADYALGLRIQVNVGDILGWQFEPIKLRLADRTFYTPDFLVQCLDGTLEFHEVKACTSAGKVLAEDDAMVKIKVAAESFPQFGFLLCGKLPAKAGGGWSIKRIS